MLRDWTMSDKINPLSEGAEIFFARLIMKADDFGCFYADPRILLAQLYPLKMDKLSVTAINKWLKECSDSKLILLYSDSDKPYLEILEFNQRLRAKNRKFPKPPTHDGQVTDTSRLEEEVEVEVEGKKKMNDIVLELPYKSEKFLETWIKLRGTKKWRRKSKEALETSLEKLAAVSEPDAIQMMKNSIAGEWQGLFELNDKNGSKKNNRSVTKNSGGDLKF